MLRSKKAKGFLVGALTLLIADKFGVSDATIESLKWLTLGYMGIQGGVDGVLASKGEK